MRSISARSTTRGRFGASTARTVAPPDADSLSPPSAPTPGFPRSIETDALPPLPPNFADTDFDTRPQSVRFQCCAHNRVAQTQGWSEREFRLYLDAYRHYTALADAEIAKALAAARRTLPDEDTLYVFFADHGDAMTAHRAVTKHTSLYEETTRVPLAFVGPGIEPGRRIDGPVSLLDLAGVAPPDGASRAQERRSGYELRIEGRHDGRCVVGRRPEK
jgi:arylsulfatase A-like enzyme